MIATQSLSLLPRTRPVTVGRSRRATRASKLRAFPPVEAAHSSGTAPSLDRLAGRWWAALGAADSALRAATSSLGAQEVGTRRRRLAEERSDVVQLLQGLAGDRYAELLLRWLATPGVTRRTLGLPAGVIACIFDLDGVLTTSADVHAAAWAETFDAFLAARAERSRREFTPFDRVRDYERSIAGRPRRDGVRAFLATRGLSLPEGSPADRPGAATVHGLANHKSALLQRRLEREGVAAFAGSRCYLEAARMLGVRRAVVSASTNLLTMLERAGLAQLIEERIDGATIEAEQLDPKPAPDTLLAACERLQVPPCRAAAFETTPAGIAAARTAGFALIIGVDRNGDTAALQASVADVTIRDLAELLDRSLPEPRCASTARCRCRPGTRSSYHRLCVSRPPLNASRETRGASGVGCCSEALARRCASMRDGASISVHI